MGAYLSAPITSKASADGKDAWLRYGCSAMQGWRRSMEDAHVMGAPIGPADEGTVMFGVFDGHGGAEVARFVARRVASELSERWREDPEVHLKALFHKMDALLREPSSREELASLKNGASGTTNHVSGGGAVVGNNAASAVDDGAGSSSSSKPSGSAQLGGGGGGDASGGPGPATNAAAGAQQRVTPREALEIFQQMLAKSARGSDVGPDVGSDDDTPSAGASAPLSAGPLPASSSAGGSIPVAAAVAPPSQRPGQPQRCELPDHPLQAGCTAVVVLASRSQRRLWCANAGDSRAVACRGGKAIPLSHDHKPDAPEEERRITAAGGYVECANGFFRVNGNLNLSRSIGDLKYKQDATRPPAEQIITAEPDVSDFAVEDSDEFFVLACDGVYDVLSSQELVDFVRPRIMRGDALSAICEAVFDRCIADNPRETRGIGGDNMTCVIVQFLSSSPKNSSSSSSSKEKQDDHAF